jgi:hypothetical protein
MNWGWKIIALYAFFVVGILTLVYKSTHEKVEMTETNYYEKELVHQDQINRRENYNALAAKCTFEQRNDSVIITYPVDLNAIESGTIHLFCPSDSKYDIFLDLPKQTGNSYAFAIGSNLPSRFNVDIIWKSEGKEYAHTQEFGAKYVH